MNSLLPPTRRSLAGNARLLAAEWRAAGSLARYFIASQLLSGLLLGLCSLASLAAGVAGLPGAYLGLLGAAALCGVQAATSWDVLKARFRVRYDIW